MDKPWKVIFAFVAVFIAGAIFGGVFTLRGSGQRLSIRPAANRPAPPAAPIGVAIMQQLIERLKLTDEQREKIRPVIQRVGEDLQRMRRENFQATNRVLERMHDDVAAVLTPEQRSELADIRRQIQQRLNNEAKRAGGFPGGRGDQKRGDGAGKSPSAVRP